MIRHVAPLVALVLVSSARAHGAPVIAVERCPETLERALPAVVNLEIEVLLRERGPGRNGPERVAIGCNGDQVFLSVTVESRRLESSLDLTELAPGHRARAVALAAAELVDSLSPRAAPEEPPRATVDRRAVPTPARDGASFRATPPEPASRSRPTLAAGFLAERLGTPKTWLFGARVSLSHPVGGLLVPSVSLDGAWGDSAVTSARVRARTISASAHLYFGATADGLRWLAGPGARVGWARLTGHPNAESVFEGGSLGGLWVGPEVRARVATEPAEPWSPAFAVELGSGYVVRPVRGLVDGAASVFALEGVWLSASAQVGVTL